MRFIKVSCPSCGGDVELSGDREYGFCTFCGSKIVRDKILVEHKGNISLDGMASEKSLLERAFLFMESKDFINAQNYFERVLDINPHCSKAYIGILMSKLQVIYIQDLGLQIIPLETYQEYSLATRFSTPDELQLYGELNKTTLKNFDREVKNLVSEKNLYERELGSLQKKKQKYEITLVLMTLLSIIMFFIISVSLPIGLMLFVSGILTAVVYNNKSKKTYPKISEIKILLQQKEQQLYDLASKYNG